LQRACGHLADESPDARDFGEILRHELNNPLTGILGNAELLIVELCRKNMELPQHDARARLETIATLAVRMRETVHRLSEGWERQWTQNGEGKVSEKA
jgi:signal transduction histidine kinase